MSVVEADLDDGGGLSEEAYLDARVQRAPPAVSLLSDAGHLQISKGFLISAAPDEDNGNSNDDLRSKNEVERMLDPDVVCPSFHRP